MKRTVYSAIIASVLLISVIGLFVASAPPEEPEPDTVTFNSVNIFPENPIGHDWTTLTGGDEITIYVDVTSDVGLAYVNITYQYCDRIGCYEGEFGLPLEGLSMLPEGGSLYSYTFVGDYAQSGLKSYEASHYQGSHISYRIRVKETDDSVTTYPPAEDAYIYPAWPPAQTNVTSQASKTTLFPGETFWVNGTSNFWNSTSLPREWLPDPPGNYSYLLPVAETNVTVSVNPDYIGKTDADGNFSVEITAPMAPGIYTVNTTVTNDSKNWNGTQNRNVPCVSQEFQIEVLGIGNVGINLVPQLIYPANDVWVNGSVKYTDGNQVISSDVNISISETGAYWLTTTNLNGDYAQLITAPATPSDYTVNVTVNDTTHSLVGSNESTMSVATPTMDIQVLPSATTTLPDTLITVNGNATYGNGEPASSSEVNISFDGEVDFWNGTTDAMGAFSINITSPSATGTFSLNVTITGNTYVVTSFNTTEILITAVPIPDLSIIQSEFIIESEDDLFLEGNAIDHKIWFNATIRNLGNANATNVVVNFTTNTTFLGTTQVNVTFGNSALASINWTAVKGNYTVNVTVDPQNLIDESFENNNNATRNLFIDGDLDDDGIGDLTDADKDGDGYNNTVDIFPDDPAEWNDTDGDGDGDNSDDDIDGDGVDNDDDDFPYDETEWSDIDGNGIGDNSDPDMDGDGVDNDDDAFPEDPNEDSDLDGDGIGDNADPDDDNDGYLDATIDPELRDTDNDGLTNDLDLDDDADGILDTEDDNPLDTDNDGQHNGNDTDDDGDGLLDTEEDVDWDGIVDDTETDYLDPDTDGDGVNDNTDYDPLDPDVTEEPSSGSSLMLPIAVAVIIVVVIFILVYLFVLRK